VLLNNDIFIKNIQLKNNYYLNFIYQFNLIDVLNFNHNFNNNFLIYHFI